MDYSSFKSGDEFNGLTLRSVVGRSEIALVALTKGGGITFGYNNLDFNEHNVLNHFHQLDSKLSRNLPDEIFKKLQRELAAALYSAFLSSNENEALSKFDEVLKRIESAKEPEEARAIFLVSSLFIAAALLTIGLLTANSFEAPIDLIIQCMCAGLGGSLFSLLNRNRTVSMNLLGANAYIYIQSVIILLTGALSGLIVYVFSQSNIAFGFASDTPYTLIAICIVSGFSERLVPDLFGRVEEQI